MRSNLKSSDQIREYAWIRYVEPARHNGKSVVSIKAGDVVKGLRLENKTPNVCAALRSKIFQEHYGLKLVGEQGPPSGMSTTVVFTYKLLGRQQPTKAKSTSQSAFDRLRGIGKETFKKLGGGETFIRGERENFYGSAAQFHGKRG